MSQVKFEERETVRTTQREGVGRGNAFTKEPPQHPPQKRDFAHTVGDAITKGAGPNGYLAVSGAATSFEWLSSALCAT